jgi:acylphosphatase
MTEHALPREIAYYVATAFTDAGGPADWSSNGTLFYATEISTEGLVRQSVENKNNRETLRQKHQNVLTLRSGGNIPVSTYMHSSPANAAEAAAAVTFHLSTLAKSALGGEDLGYAIGLASSGAEQTDEIEVDSDPGFVKFDWVFPYDVSAGEGEFYQIQDIVAGPPVTLTLDRDRHFTVDNGGGDRTYAVIDNFIDDQVTVDRTQSAHTTLWLRFQGEHTEDVHTAMGCKPQMGPITITPGEPLEMPLDVLVTTHTHETDTKDDFSAVVPKGSAPAVPGIADKTLVKIADFGSPLATVAAIGSITINPGVTYSPIPGPNGWEGVHGYIDNGDDTTVELMVEFDDDYATDFNAKTTYHMLIQVGTGTDAVGFYFPRLEQASYPVRADEGNVTVCRLSLRALKSTVSISGLAGTNAIKARSPFHVLFVA